MKQTILVCDRHADESRPATQSFVIRPLGEAAQRVDLCAEDASQLTALLWPNGKAAVGLGHTNGAKRPSSRPRADGGRKTIPPGYEWRDGAIRPVKLATKNPLLVDRRGYRRPSGPKLVALVRELIARPGAQPRTYQNMPEHHSAITWLQQHKALHATGTRQGRRWFPGPRAAEVLAEAERVLAGTASAGANVNERRSESASRSRLRQPKAKRKAIARAGGKARWAKARALASTAS